jgi:hypothetical protein
MDRTGPTTSAMLNRYRRAARSATELGLGPLVSLSTAIAEFEQLVSVAGPEGGPKKDLSGETKQSKNADSKTKAEVAEWQTRRIQNPLSARV